MFENEAKEQILTTDRIKLILKSRDMARRRNKNSATNSPSKFKIFRLAILLIALVLIKIGGFPIWVISNINRLIRTITLPKLKVPTIHFLLPTLKITLPQRRHYHKRGRPRTQPLRTFLLNKLKKKFRQSVPKEARWRVALGIVIIFLVSYSLILVKITSSLPSPYSITQSSNPLTTQIYDRSGHLLYQFYEGRNRKLVKLTDLPTHLVQATISMEDKNFYSHPGIDLGGIFRATRNNLHGQSGLQGGSTITQQLIKNTLLTPDQTFARKIKEIILAFWTEAIYSKEEILQAYFNESPYGGPAWGIQVASEMYFGKDAKDLSLAEASFLAGLPAAPTDYSPYGTHPERAKLRQKEVLRRMVEDGYITSEQATHAYSENLSIKSPSTDIKAPHFVMYVRSLLAQKYGEKVVSQGGLKVTTTLDLAIQQMSEDVVQNQVRALSHLRVGNGAAMVTEAQTGQILAMVGSKDYFEDQTGNFNVALALRQPGSSIKPVTYATGFKSGYSPGNIILDTPTTFANAWERYSPVNYDGKFHGAVTIRTALGSSYNIPAVKMLALVGIPEMINTASDMGITTFTNPSDYGLSLTLGGGAVRMLDMMSVYSVFANSGIKNPPQPILIVTDANGQLLEDHRHDRGRKVLSEEIAYLISHILSDKKARAPAFGTNSLLEIRDHQHVAVKTGTSDDKRDNWAFGYSTNYVVGSWVGNNDNSPMDSRLTSGVTGATPIWHQIMTNLLKDSPDLAFKRPATIVEGTVDGRRDLVIANSTTKSIISLQKAMKKSEEDGSEKEVITFSDPFTRAYSADQLKATQ